MNKLSKILIINLIMILIISFSSSFLNVSFAGETPAAGGGTTGFDWKSSISEFESATGNDSANEATKNIVGAMAVIIKIVGTGVAVIMLVVLAIKYMMAAPGDKADIKKHAVVYIVGAVILFASTQIIGIIAEFSSNIKM